MKEKNILGIPIKINELFILVIIAYAFLGVLPQALILFTIVLIHEFSHCITAIKNKIAVKNIEIFPFGGVAHLDFLEGDSDAEFQIALAGPITNFIMAGIGFLVIYYWGANYWVNFFIRTNLVIGIFNLLPILPLDGGRLYRSIKAQKIGIYLATQQASKYGKIVAVIIFMLGSLGIYYRYSDISVVLLAVFLYISADSQYNTATFRFIRFLTHKKKQFSKSNILEAEKFVARKENTLENVIPHLKPEKYGILILTDSKGNIIKEITEEQLIDAYFKYGPKMPLSNFIK